MLLQNFCPYVNEETILEWENINFKNLEICVLEEYKYFLSMSEHRGNNHPQAVI